MKSVSALERAHNSSNLCWLDGAWSQLSILALSSYIGRYRLLCHSNSWLSQRLRLNNNLFSSPNRHFLGPWRRCRSPRSESVSNIDQGCNEGDHANCYAYDFQCI